MRNRGVYDVWDGMNDTVTKCLRGYWWIDCVFDSVRAFVNEDECMCMCVCMYLCVYKESTSYTDTHYFTHTCVHVYRARNIHKHISKHTNAHDVHFCILLCACARHLLIVGFLVALVTHVVLITILNRSQSEHKSKR